MDGNYETYMYIDEFPAEIEFSIPFPKECNVFMIQEYIKKGQRIEEFMLEAFINDEWLELGTSTTVGYKKMLRFDKISSDRFRLTINKSRDNAMLNEIGLFLAPPFLPGNE